MRRPRYLLLLVSVLLHVALIFVVMHIWMGGELAHHETGTAPPDFVAEMKIPARPVEVATPGSAGHAGSPTAPNVAIPQAPAPTDIITTVTGPSFVVPGLTSSTTDAMMRALNRVTASEHRGSGSSPGPGVNIGGVTVNEGENLGVVLDISGSMILILPQIRKVLAEHFADCPIFEAKNSLGKYFRGDEAKRTDDEPAIDPDLYQGCYALLDKGVSAIYIFTDFEDGEDKRATECLVEDLQKANVKLYICYTEGPPYQGLVDYCKASGGECRKFVPEKEQAPQL